MFITTRKHLDDYCKFLFPLLRQVRKRIGESKEEAYHKRYCAFFAERLLTPWIVYNNFKSYEASIFKVGPWHYRLFIKLYYSRFRRFFPMKYKDYFAQKARRSSY